MAEQTFSEWLEETPLPSEVVEFTARQDAVRKLQRVRIQVQSMAQLDLARARAFERVTDKTFKPEHLTHAIPAAVYQDTIAREVLVASCTTINAIEVPATGGGIRNVYPLIFKHVGHISQLLDAEDVKWLWDQYLRIERDNAPMLVDDEDEEEDDVSAE
jgi:hypothetical protein